MFETLHWTVELPAGWEANEEESVATLIAPNGGVGALQISTFVNEDQVVTSKTLLEFAQKEQPTGTVVHLCTVGNMPAAELIYDRDARSWRKVWMGEGHILLYITYNCRKGEERIEKDQVNFILSSLRLRRLSTPPNGG
jgi:hypothetical protein